VEYEALVNDILPEYTDADFICVYDVTKFNGGAIVDVMRTHPMIMIGGALHENPHYVPTAAFLPEWRARRAARSMRA